MAGRQLRIAAIPVLFAAGATCVVVAIIGLFARSSPGLSSVFVVAGTAMLIVSVLGPRVPDVANRTEPRTHIVDLTQLEHSARAAETEIATGTLQEAARATARISDPTQIHAFVSNAAMNHVRDIDEDTMRAVTQELEALPTLEETSHIAPIDELPAGYQCITLPSGYIVLYRRLTPMEIRLATGSYTDQPAYLIADLLPLIESAKA
jgi:hypothetical protein